MAELTPAVLAAIEADLNERLKNTGRAAGSWSEEEYADELERASAGRSQVATAAALNEAIETALLLVGDDPEVVTHADIAARATEILEGQGIGGLLGRSGTSDDNLAAASQAVRELGRPGEARRDRGERADEAFEAVLARAIEDGKILASRADAYRTWFDVRPAETLQTIADLPTAYATTIRGEKFLVEEESQLAFDAAERLIAERGWGETHPVTGALVYSDETLAEALQEVENAPVRRRPRRQRTSPSWAAESRDA